MDRALEEINRKASRIVVNTSHTHLLRTIKKLLSGLGIKKDTRILDVGCGLGYITHILYSCGYCNIYGFDSSQDFITSAKNNFPDINMRLDVHDAEDKTLPDSLPKDNYGLIISVENIEHIYHIAKYFYNLHSWLRQDGYLIITTPYHGFLKNLLLVLSGRLDNHFQSGEDGGHIRFFSKKSIYTLLRKNGFLPLGFCGSGGLPLLWNSMVVIAVKK